MKNHTINVLFILLSLTYTGKNAQAQNGSIQKSIVLIFDSVKSYDSIKLPDGNYLSNQAQISYINKYYQEEISTMNYKGQSDTARVYCYTDQIVIGIRYFDTDWLYCLFNAGDTIHVSYSGEFPVCSLVNRKCLPYDINYQTLKRKNFNQKAPLSLFYHLLNNPNKSLGHKTIYQSKYDDFIRETNFMDSIYRDALISDINYTFYKEISRYYFLCYTKGMQNAGIKMDEKLLKTDKADLQNNKMLQCRTYQWFLKYYVDNKLQYTKPNVTHGGTEFDSRILYDSVRKSDLFSPKVRSYLLLNYIQEICGKQSASDIKNYFRKFEADIPDSSLVNFVAKKFMVNEPNVSVNNADLMLLSATGEKTTLTKLLESQKGKVVVVDFWASWCAPCRRLMPEYDSLINKFKANNVVVVYLSVDKVKDDWLRASKQESIEKYPFNYLIFATEHNFTETIQLKTIPRGVIFDKNGILVCKDAPHPGTNQLNEMIVSYLKKKTFKQ